MLAYKSLEYSLLGKKGWQHNNGKYLNLQEKAHKVMH